MLWKTPKRQSQLVVIAIVVSLFLVGSWIARLNPSTAALSPETGHLEVEAGHNHFGGTNQTGIYLSPHEINYGEQFQSDVVRREFVLHNKGTNAVRLVAIETTCQCTTAATNLLGKIVEPDGLLSIPVSLDTTGKDGPSESTILVMVEDRSNGSLLKRSCSLKGVVLGDFSYSPHFADFGVVEPGSTNRVSVRFVPKILRDLEVIPQVKAPFHARVSKTPSDQVLELTLVAPATPLRIPIHEEIVVKTSSRRMPILKISANATVVPDLDVIPTSIVLGAGGAGTEGFINLTLQARTQSQLQQISSVLENGELIQCDGTEITPNRSVGPEVPCQIRIPKKSLQRSRSILIETAALIGANKVLKTNKTEVSIRRMSP